MADFLAAVIIHSVNSQHNFSFFYFATAKRYGNIPSWYGVMRSGNESGVK